MRRTTKILSLAALTAVSAYGKSTMAAAETWTGAVNNTWDAANASTLLGGTQNWSAGGAPVTYLVGDDTFFTDNFTGPTNIDLATGGFNPASMTFQHIAGSAPTTYTFDRFKNGNLSASASSTPFGASAGTVLTLDTGFLGKVILQNRATNTGAGSIVTGNTIIRSGTLEIQDAGALPNGLNSSGTLSNAAPRITLDGGTLVINPLTYTASADGITPPTFVASPAASSQLTGTLTVLSNSTLAYGNTVDGRFYNGTIAIASNATLRVTSLSGFQGQFSGTNGSGGADGDFSQSTGTVLFQNTGVLANNFRFENARASGINATFDLGVGSTTLNNNFANSGSSGGGTLTLGALFGGASTKLYGSAQSVASVSGAAPLQLIDTYQIGTKNIDSQFDGTINDGTATVTAGSTLNRKVAVTKNGTGVLTLTGLNTYTGSTNVAGGTLSVSTVADTGVNSNIGAGTQVFVTGGALKHTGAAAASTNRLLNVTATGGTLDSSGGGLTFSNAVVSDNDAASRGGTIVPGSNVLSFSIVGNQATGNILGQGNTSDLAVGMTVTNSVAFPSGPATITAVGLGTVTLDTPAVAGGTISNATVAFGVANRTLTLAGTTTGTIAGTLANTTLGGQLNVAKVGTGAWTLNGANTSTGSVSATGGTLNFGTASNLSSGAVSANGGSIVLAAGHVNAEPITSLSIGASSSALDVRDNDLIISSATPKTTIEGYVRSARDGGLWDMAGLTTSLAKPVGGQQTPFALAVLSGAEYAGDNANNTAFSGKSFASTDTLVKYTYNGDADLSGNINANDYGHIDSGYQNQSSAGFVFDYYHGDFDYNGVINANDYALIDGAYQLQNGTLRAAIDYLETGVAPTGTISSSLQEVIDHNTEFGAAYANDFIFANVPEPVSVGVIAVGAFGMMSRRRRRSI